MLNLHVVFAIDRAGLVGDDGPTHHGVFDIGFLRQIPGMRILNPASLAEQKDMLRWAVRECNGPGAVRYPRGTEGSWKESAWTGPDTTAVSHKQGSDVTLITYGAMLDNALEAARLLEEQGISAGVVRLLSASHWDIHEIRGLMGDSAVAVIIEDVCSGSGIREALAWDLRRADASVRVEGIDLGSDYVPHGNQKILYEYCKVDPASICAFTKKVLNR